MFCGKRAAEDRRNNLNRKEKLEDKSKKEEQEEQHRKENITNNQNQISPGKIYAEAVRNDKQQDNNINIINDMLHKIMARMIEQEQKQESYNKLIFDRLVALEGDKNQPLEKKKGKKEDNMRILE